MIRERELGRYQDLIAVANGSNELNLYMLIICTSLPKIGRFF